ncbi:MAG TPA: beta-CASP ribonuclease aCPSF1 [Methanocorpusculum sp.]|nr:beta-CASP ribonuclease aCPSF1 [Candidatus Methanocorpusculum equi]MCQ2358214.1 beta-CASP ribonuclease aCPSF1 [Methanocorpusculum sp.]HJJ33407.1 beta-CASP ribonuclease aCPSF1 [Methanocorpusculum sp.]HJJ45058.1 beta-CASP ribonuclease aCPSF1 [Methanocorpusculum sp.]
MQIEEQLLELKETINKKVPSGVKVTDVEYEGPEMVIYTDNPEKIAAEQDLIKTLARDLRKRIVVRPNILGDTEVAYDMVKKVVPESAGITDIFFDTDTGEMLIEAEKPGVVIGKNGTMLRDITIKTGWTPRVVRTPPIPSTTIKQVRQYLRETRDERKEFLRRCGKRIHRNSVFTGRDKNQWLRITTLGCCRQVGRAAFLLTTPQSKVLIDCGEAPGATGSASTPYLHVPEIYPFESLDAVILTHAHLDHCAYVPLLYRYGYDGPVYTTPATRDLAAMLQLDYLDVNNKEDRAPPYSSNEVREFVKHTIAIGYGDVTDIAPDLKLTLHNAGHILGSAIAHFNVGNGLYNVAFTGDLYYAKSRLFNPAVSQFPRLEALVMESTYGSSEDFSPSRIEAEEQLCQVISETLSRGGKVLIPAFAVGRSQELMLAIEEGMRNKKIPSCKVYLDGMIKEATAMHTAYPEYLNTDLRNQIFRDNYNPFLAECFEQVDTYDKRQEVIFSKDPCVIISTSGMLNGGPVIEYLTNLAESEKNTLIFVGYQAEGTYGRRIQKGWREIPVGKKGTIIINMNVLTVEGFSGHADRKQLMNYVQYVQPKPERVFTIHGEESKTIDLASSIYKKYHIQTVSPQNLETYRLM